MSDCQDSPFIVEDVEIDDLLEAARGMNAGSVVSANRDTLETPDYTMDLGDHNVLLTQPQVASSVASGIMSGHDTMSADSGPELLRRLSESAMQSRESAQLSASARDLGAQLHQDQPPLPELSTADISPVLASVEKGVTHVSSIKELIKTFKDKTYPVNDKPVWYEEFNFEIPFIGWQYHHATCRPPTLKPEVEQLPFLVTTRAANLSQLLVFRRTRTGKPIYQEYVSAAVILFLLQETELKIVADANFANRKDFDFQRSLSKNVTIKDVQGAETRLLRMSANSTYAKVRMLVPFLPLQFELPDIQFPDTYNFSVHGHRPLELNLGNSEIFLYGITNVRYCGVTYAANCRHRTSSWDEHPWCVPCHIKAGLAMCEKVDDRNDEHEENSPCPYCFVMGPIAMAARQKMWDNWSNKTEDPKSNRLVLKVLTQFDADLYSTRYDVNPDWYDGYFGFCRPSWIVPLFMSWQEFWVALNNKVDLLPIVNEHRANFLQFAKPRWLSRQSSTQLQLHGYPELYNLPTSGEFIQYTIQQLETVFERCQNLGSRTDSKAETHITVSTPSSTRKPTGGKAKAAGPSSKKQRVSMSGSRSSVSKYIDVSDDDSEVQTQKTQESVVTPKRSQTRSQNEQNLSSNLNWSEAASTSAAPVHVESEVMDTSELITPARVSVSENLTTPRVIAQAEATPDVTCQSVFRPVVRLKQSDRVNPDSTPQVESTGPVLDAEDPLAISSTRRVQTRSVAKDPGFYEEPSLDQDMPTLSDQDQEPVETDEPEVTEVRKPSQVPRPRDLEHSLTAGSAINLDSPQVREFLSRPMRKPESTSAPLLVTCEWQAGGGMPGVQPSPRPQPRTSDSAAQTSSLWTSRNPLRTHYRQSRVEAASTRYSAIRAGAALQGQTPLTVDVIERDGYDSILDNLVPTPTYQVGTRVIDTVNQTLGSYQRSAYKPDFAKEIRANTLGCAVSRVNTLPLFTRRSVTGAYPVDTNSTNLLQMEAIRMESNFRSQVKLAENDTHLMSCLIAYLRSKERPVLDSFTGRLVKPKLTPDEQNLVTLVNGMRQNFVMRESLVGENLGILTAVRRRDNVEHLTKDQSVIDKEVSAVYSEQNLALVSDVQSGGKRTIDQVSSDSDSGSKLPTCSTN
jgi:hypothetical protein